MTREEAAKLLPIIKAFCEGKTIQYRMGYDWFDIPNTDSLVLENLDRSPSSYRIKPTPTYRPYHNLKECFRDMKNHEPFGYIRQKQKGDLELIVGTLYDEHEYLKLSVSCISQLDTVFERYTYFDGSPFGVKKEG